MRGQPAARAPRGDITPPGASRIEDGRFVVYAFPEDVAFAQSLIARSIAADSFPGLPRPEQRVFISIAPDAARFREWIGPRVPGWGAAVAFPHTRRIVMQGGRAGASAGNPMVTLRHELAHLALRERLTFTPPRWFDEGYASYAAGEWRRGDVLAANVALVAYRLPTLDSLDRWFFGGAARAQAAYALSHAAVTELAGMDEERGLTLFLQYWDESESFEQAIRQAYGVTSARYETLWQRRVKLRYGLLGILTDAAFAGVILVLLIGPVWWTRRRRDRRRLATMKLAEAAAERRAREQAIALLIAAQLPPSVPGDAPRDPEEPPTLFPTTPDGGGPPAAGVPDHDGGSSGDDDRDDHRDHDADRALAGDDDRRPV